MQSRRTVHVVVQNRRGQHAAAYVASDILPVELRLAENLVVAVRPACVHVNDQDVAAQRLLPRRIRLNLEIHSRGINIVIRVYGVFDGLVEL
jgi:hypothetical protein